MTLAATAGADPVPASLQIYKCGEDVQATGGTTYPPLPACAIPPPRPVTAAGELAILGLTLLGLGLFWGRDRDHPQRRPWRMTRATHLPRRHRDRRTRDRRQAERRLRMCPDY